MTPDQATMLCVTPERYGTKQIEDCSRRAAQKIVAKFRTGKISTDSLAKLIAEEFEELSR
ncbi:MAG TPA: hypothetical protein VGR97_11845 [Candidatus Acidoferrales bacterium]|nr:hypothetical protein [Candidatus Acidoferrales bacterium]